MFPLPVACMVRPSADLIGCGGISLNVINFSLSDEKCRLAPQSMMIGGPFSDVHSAAWLSIATVVISAMSSSSSVVDAALAVGVF